MNTVQNKEIREALQAYTLEAANGQLFDAVQDNLDMADFSTFELDRLMNMGEDKVIPVLLYLFNGFGGTHPMPVHRTKELEKWVQSGTYDQIMKGHYVREKLG